MPSIEQRLARVEANTDSIDKIEGYIGKLYESVNGIGHDITVIKCIQEDMKIGQKEYTASCTEDRKNFNHRIMEVEGFKSQITWAASIIAAIISVGFTSTIEWFRR